MSAQTEPGDPEFKVFENVAKWHNTITCMPSWLEILEFEYVRQSGDLNMATKMNNVQRYAFDRDLYHCVNWIQRCKDANISVNMMYNVSLAGHEKEHGNRTTWITGKMKDTISARALEAKKQKIYEELAEIKRQQKSLKKKRASE